MDSAIDTRTEVDAEKRKAKLEQLQKDEARRQEEREQRRRDQTDKADPEENVNAFLAGWERAEAAAVFDLEAFGAGAPARDAVSRAKAKEDADAITSQLFDLNRTLSAAAYFLPPYEVRALTDALLKLHSQLQSSRGHRLPHVPFQFSHPDVILLVENPLEQGLRSSKDQHGRSQAVTIDMTTVASDPDTLISGKTGATVTITAERLGRKDWMLSELEGCTIRLLGPLQALYLHRLKNCHIEAGPISGATFGESIQGSTLLIATHQLRLHHVKDTNVYVRPGSDPIIEHCSAVGIAPLAALPYDNYAADLAAAAIAAEGERWQRVQDFQYPGHERTPNWHIIPEEERQPRARES